MDGMAIPAELGALLREGRALAVHAQDGVGIFSGNAASIQGFAPSEGLRRALVSLAATLPRSGAVTLLDVPLNGAQTATVPAGCRLLSLEDGQRLLVIIPVVPWTPAGSETGTKEGKPERASDPFHAVKTAMQAQLTQAAPAPAAEATPGVPIPAEAPAVASAAPVRILWQSDAEGRITQIGARLQALVGAQSGAVLGQRWSDLLGDSVIDRDTALTQALASRASASRVPLLWSVDDAPGPVEVDWSALPVHDRQGRFQGFRGFLLVHPQSAEAPGNSGAPSPAVPLSAAPSQDPAPAQPVTQPALSESERLAFRELARALAARTETEKHEPEQAGQTLSAPIDDEPEPPASVQDAVAPMAPPPQAPTAPEQPNPATPDHAATAIADPVPAAAKAPQPASVTPAPETAAMQPVTVAAPNGDHAIAIAPAPEKSVPPEPMIIPAPVTHIVRVPDPRYLDVIERLPIGVMISRAERVLFANRTLLDLLDYHSVADIAEAGGTQAIFKGRIPLNERDGPSGPILLSARDGERIGVDARLQDIHWDGEPATLVSFRRSADIELGQKLRAAENDLKARETQLRETRAILDTTTDGVAVLDENGRILSINRTAEALFGYEQKEMAGESVTEFIAPESRASVLDYFEGLKSGGVRSVLNDGREVTARVRQGGRIPVFLSFGQITEKPERKFCAVMRDLTAWKKSERELIDARKTAENASAQKSDFLAKISHEVRTPLNAIIGFAEVMMEERFGPVGNERYKDYLKDIHESGGHVISLVNDLLDLSKIEAGKMELDFTSVNVNEVVRGAVSIMQPQSQRGRIVIRSAMTTKLPPVVADERALKQIVLNLLSNAVKFTDPGGQVIVSTTQSDLGEVAIRVRDTGIGMTPQEVEQAMEPFKQLSATRRAGGTGLGLPLTKALVEANRAAIRISSVKNEGTLVEIVFPPTRVMAAQ